MIIREAIYGALWSLAAGAASFASANRRLRHSADLAPAEQPALFMSEKGGHAVIKTLGAPIIWTLYADFYIYVHSSDPYLAPAMLFEPAARRTRSCAGAISGDRDSEPWIAYDGAACLHRRKGRDRRGRAGRPSHCDRSGRDLVRLTTPE